MSRDAIAEYFADHTVRRAILPEIQTAARRIESLVEQMQAGENPEINPQRLEEIADASRNIRAHAKRL